MHTDRMSSNYRKSAGRFGEEDDDHGVDRLPVRPSIEVVIGTDRISSDPPNDTFSDDVSDPLMTKSIDSAYIFHDSNDDDDMSSLGNDTAAYSIIAPSLPDDLPSNQPMSDEEWKANVMAATNQCGSGHIKTTKGSSGTLRKPQNALTGRSLPIVEDDSTRNRKDQNRHSGQGD